MVDRVNPLQPERPLHSEVPIPQKVPIQPDEPTDGLLEGEMDVAADVLAEPVVLDVADLVRRFHADLYRYAYRLTGSVADAEDLTQQAFLIAQRKLHQVRDVERVKGWLYAVLRSCFLKSCRKSLPMTATAADLQVDQIPQEMVDDDLIDRTELQAALNQLSDDFRLVVLMFYFEDRSYKDIATALDLPIGTVMSRLARAKGHLRKLLVDNNSPSEPRSEATRPLSAVAARAAAASAPDPQGHVPRHEVPRGPAVGGESFGRGGNRQAGHAPR